MLTNGNNYLFIYIMRLAIKTIVFHFSCIFLFSLFYFYFKDNFNTQQKGDEFTMLDSFFLSTTIQAGVGLSDVFPISSYGKLIMIVQQLSMIMTHVFTLYLFNLHI
jgi:hypothetical protein